MQGRIIITGGAGFLGRGILRRAEREGWDAEFVVYSRDELKQAQCRRRYPRVRYVLGDVRDTERLALLMNRGDTIIHTAALKYVPEAEYNVGECIDVNVGGTRSVLAAAMNAEVGQVVVVSTDKAVAPANVYGMTKALCERLVGETVQYDGVRAVAVRYGNVVGSTGSIVPELLSRAARGEDITITDGNMTRFWLSVDEAIDLILCAATTDVANGSVLIPSPRAMRLEDLVCALLPESSYRVVGARPGEKMHETLLTEAESLFVRPVLLYNELPAVEGRQQQHLMPWTISSEDSVPMTADEFVAIVEDSKGV